MRHYTVCLFLYSWLEKKLSKFVFKTYAILEAQETRTCAVKLTCKVLKCAKINVVHEIMNKLFGFYNIHISGSESDILKSILNERLYEPKAFEYYSKIFDKAVDETVQIVRFFTFLKKILSSSHVYVGFQIPLPET